METAWSKHAIDKKFEQISTMSLENPDLNKLSETFNKLDKQITEIMTAAEKRCTKPIPIAEVGRREHSGADGEANERNR